MRSLFALCAASSIALSALAMTGGYAAAHPEVATFRKEGAPSVSIRARG